MKLLPIHSLLFAAALTGCIKMPKAGNDPDDPQGPVRPDYPPPLRITSIPTAMNPAA